MLIERVDLVAELVYASIPKKKGSSRRPWKRFRIPRPGVEDVGPKKITPAELAKRMRGG